MNRANMLPKISTVVPVSTRWGMGRFLSVRSTKAGKMVEMPCAWQAAWAERGLQFLEGIGISRDLAFPHLSKLRHFQMNDADGDEQLADLQALHSFRPARVARDVLLEIGYQPADVAALLDGAVESRRFDTDECWLEWTDADLCNSSELHKDLCNYPELHKQTFHAGVEYFRELKEAWPTFKEKLVHGYCDYQMDSSDPPNAELLAPTGDLFPSPFKAFYGSTLDGGGDRLQYGRLKTTFNLTLDEALNGPFATLNLFQIDEHSKQQLLEFLQPQQQVLNALDTMSAIEQEYTLSTLLVMYCRNPEDRVVQPQTFPWQIVYGPYYHMTLRGTKVPWSSARLPKICRRWDQIGFEVASAAKWLYQQGGHQRKSHPLW
eukprot:TRINITY_DN66941_c2_g8_i1.p1 TRINITY_DN66941_c2_g8~~TRINITY_DN66941_c2_g8_i1.p1  ORF type:complete len:376 (-),score=5.23 TRINITY_DN66941_c2_g8_i1:132-1259(-)